MKLSSKFFFLLSSVVGTVSIVAEPCLPEGNDNTNGGYAIYDQPACDACAHSGKQTGACYNAIYTHSCGRDDDDWGDGNDLDLCVDVNHGCLPSQGSCYPGLFCDGPDGSTSSTCTLLTDNPEAHAASSLLTSSSSTGTTTKSGPSFVLVVVGLLGAAMMALKVVQLRYRGLLRRHHYSDVDATATRMDA